MPVFGFGMVTQYQPFAAIGLLIEGNDGKRYYLPLVNGEPVGEPKEVQYQAGNAWWEVENTATVSWDGPRHVFCGTWTRTNQVYARGRILLQTTNPVLGAGLWRDGYGQWWLHVAINEDDRLAVWRHQVTQFTTGGITSRSTGERLFLGLSIIGLNQSVNFNTTGDRLTFVLNGTVYEFAATGDQMAAIASTGDGINFQVNYYSYYINNQLKYSRMSIRIDSATIISQFYPNPGRYPGYHPEMVANGSGTAFQSAYYADQSLMWHRFNEDYAPNTGGFYEKGTEPDWFMMDISQWYGIARGVTFDRIGFPLWITRQIYKTLPSSRVYPGGTQFIFNDEVIFGSTDTTWEQEIYPLPLYGDDGSVIDFPDYNPECPSKPAYQPEYRWSFTDYHGLIQAMNEMVDDRFHRFDYRGCLFEKRIFDGRVLVTPHTQSGGSFTVCGDHVRILGNQPATMTFDAFHTAWVKLPTHLLDYRSIKPI